MYFILKTATKETMKVCLGEGPDTIRGFSS